MCLIILSLGPDTRAVVISHDVLKIVDPRESANFQQHPELNAIGLLVNGAGDISTAFLIGDCYILSSRHSVFHDDAHPVQSENILFKAGRHHSYGKWWYFEDVAEAVPIIWGGQESNLSDYSIGDDWAVLRVKPCLGLRYPTLKLMRLDSKANPKMKVANLSRAFLPVSSSVLWDVGGKIVRDFGSYWAINNAIQIGDSGGPVLVLDQNSVYEAIGVISSQDLLNGKAINQVLDFSESSALNYCAVIDRFYERLKEAVERDAMGDH